MSDDIKRISAREFRERGYLQEVNRCFLHPLGLALEVVTAEDGTERFGGVWDYRDDPEGMAFTDGPDEGKADRVADEWDQKAAHRQVTLGFIVQPPGVALPKQASTGGSDG